MNEDTQGKITIDATSLRELAWAIFYALHNAGAGVGNASVNIIEAAIEQFHDSQGTAGNESEQAAEEAAQK